MSDARKALEIVEKSEIDSLRRWRKAFYALVGLGILFVGIQIGEAWAYRETRASFEKSRQDLANDRQQLKELAAEMKTMWAEQRDDMMLDTTWAEYVKQRDDLVSMNKRNAPTDLVGMRHVQQNNYTLHDQEKK